MKALYVLLALAAVAPLMHAKIRIRHADPQLILMLLRGDHPTMPEYSTTRIR